MDTTYSEHNCEFLWLRTAFCVPTLSTCTWPYFLSAMHTASGQRLQRATKDLNQGNNRSTFQLVFDFFTLCVFSSDPTLTMDNLVTVMEEVRELGKVKMALGVPNHLMDDQHCPSVREKKLLVGKYYLQTVLEASWKDLTERLYLCGEYSAWERAKEKGMWGNCLYLFISFE